MKPSRKANRQVRRQVRLLLARTLLSAAILAAAGFGYMLFEAQWLRLRRRRLELPGLPSELEGLKLLHISDLHAGAPGPAGRAIGKLIKASRRADADLVLFTGDMTDKKKDLRPWLPLLAEIGGRYGKFAVLGNHDHGLRKTVLQDLARRFTGRNRLGSKEIPVEDLANTVSLNRELLAQSGIRLLENECAIVMTRGGSVQVCGMDDFQYGYADFESTASQVDRQAGLRVLLSHSPDVAELLTAGSYDLILAGHTHGGQICIPHPTKGKILLSTSGSDFGAGIYRIGRLTMHVSPGVGTTLLPFRFLSRPEITLLELVSGE
ncbi:MAG: metallophosphoesterase [Actinobacteria bacterium]|nr:metallophosphoesterase [Actinomycetota bacterium]